MDAFLSHNRVDKPTARDLGAQLVLSGAYVWFDDWEVRAGDSLPGIIGEALESADTLILLWSSNADRSGWVRAELETAISRAMEDDHFRVMVVRLDDTPVPPLLRPLKWVDMQEGDLTQAVNELMGFATDQERLKAIQETLDSAGIRIEYFVGYGPAVCCPRCGAGVEQLTGWSQTDYARDDTYAGVRCRSCGFEDGGEI